ncbi:restriction endonuclease subunit S [Stutzerimonas stutzeri]|uniref:restriction endonuclease subunit S n=1 Tax=Stutzerimonas stutzeri TaxID=316 RepID=UPI0002EB0F72|nr:restriction endonuclease subunit S [Stutzerimonas stutzeri]
MTALLTDNLPLLAGAPNGIKKLRELILELAVRGKLVPQDPNDEPASELLKRIAQEKARLVVDGSTKKQKQLPGIAQDETPFDVPAGWCWVRMGAVGETNIGLTYSPSDVGDIGIPVLRSSNVQKGQVDLSDLVRVDLLVKESALVQEGDLLICARNGSKALVGKTAMISNLTEPMAFGAFMAIFRSRLNPYLLRFINSPLFRKVIDDVNTTTINQITQNNLRTTLLPLPPLAEQHRLVAKIDELMALCDRLEAQQADAESAHAQLVQALLGSLTQAVDAEDFAASWQRLAEHFHTLFTTESSIDALKQTLLQLAVMGKLVPQDPSDEPASELLKRVAEKKARLISEEGLRTTAREDVPEAEYYFTLHAGWASYRLGNIARFIDYRGRTPTKTPSGVPLITAKNVRPGFISREPQEFIADTDYLSWMTRGFPRVGDMLFTTEAPMGNVAIIDIPDQFALAQRVICFQLHELEIGPFLKLVMMSSGFQAQLSDAATGMTATGIKSSRLKEIPVPVPPLPEQHRIVAKVDQLMALCDQLKTRLNQARQLNEQLATALVEQAVA